ncbi:Hemolysin-type calcium-binding region [Limimaricola hongkongensis DSM 17492]|uniref:Hemolysin-type calcium-binding region n=2 Tax=Limimaricola hongkongensis TaxID=278132 RepID=A0A017HAM3_9RHOB|nr:Hemolysin-type calcium-binding region [Limimaricola hongkongensis DSM 17492]
MVLSYLGDGFEPDQSPARAVISFKEASLFTPSQGREAGQDLFLDGLVDKIVWFNEAGARLMVLDQVDLDAGLFHHYLRNEPWQAYDLLVSGGSRFISNAPDRDGNDITTGVGDDIVRIVKGGSYIKDTGGSDSYEGHADGHDAVTYDHWNFGGRLPERGIDANLEKGRILGPDGEIDRISSVEEVRGTNLADVFRGNGQDNTFHGFRGNDLMIGGGGFDIVSYRRDDESGGDDAVSVNLARGRARDGFGTTDRLRSIEGAEGSDQDDLFRDDRGDNYFNGHDGDDRFFLKVGNDVVFGDDGADTFIFLSRKFGSDRIGDFNPDEGDRIDIRAAASIDDVSIFTDMNGTGIELNGKSSVFLEDYFGAVEPYLLL